MKILVLGSKGHDRVQSFDWMEPLPNMEECDAVIIDLTTMDQNLFDKFARDAAFIKLSPDRASTIRQQLTTIFETGREIFCIMNEILTPTRKPGEPKFYITRPPTNYDILFVIPKIETNEGESLTIAEARFEPYLSKVGKWKFEVHDIFNNQNDDSLDMSSATTYGLASVAYNRSDKIIAAKVISKSKPNQGRLYLLPPVTKCSPKEGVEILIDIITQQAPVVRPQWWSQIEVLGLQEIDKEIENATNEIGTLYDKITDFETEKKQLEEYRDLLVVEGDRLVTVVQRVLKDFGIHTEKTQSGFPMDLIEKNKIAVEVTATADKIDSDSDKMFQIIQFQEKYHDGEKIVLIANTYRRQPPDKREEKMHFTQPVIDFAKSQKVCCLSTTTLWAYWKKAKKDANVPEEFRNKIFNTDGELV